MLVINICVVMQDRVCFSRPSQDKKQRSSQVTIKMRNVMMQLRKCCNHPYLLEHPLDPKTGDLALTDGVISASGKMLVLDKMLAELKKRGHRVFTLFFFKNSFGFSCGSPIFVGQSNLRFLLLCSPSEGHWFCCVAVCSI